MRATDSSTSSIVRGIRDVAGLSRYDLVLAVIPLALAAGTLSGATVLPDPVGVGVGGVVALAATAYALFGDPPVEPRNGRRRRGFRSAD